MKSKAPTRAPALSPKAQDALSRLSGNIKALSSQTALPKAPLPPTLMRAQRLPHVNPAQMRDQLLGVPQALAVMESLKSQGANVAQQRIAQRAILDAALPAKVEDVESLALKATIVPQALETPVLALSIQGGTLIPEGFTFDDSQLRALEKLAFRSCGCLIGAAGTGKTTCTKAFVQHIANTVKSVDANYVERKQKLLAGEDSTNVPERWIPSILLCGFTGRSVRQIRKNFPQSWHGNIKTIHRALRYMPVMVEGMDENGALVTKRIFEPWHTESNKMPWDVVIVDEASMVSLDLWERFIAAMQDGTRVYMIGDINQLPPVHGKSVFGFAMAKWGVAELTHVHRQVGSKDQIVPNAHRILQGKTPQDDGNFRMMALSRDPLKASQQVLALVRGLKRKGVYNELFDNIITAVNGDKPESPTAPLGQIPLNTPLSMFFNPDAKRVMIDCGRSRKLLAVGDKVMATKNDYATGVTNGMMGIITEITKNGAYGGDPRAVGDWESVQKYMAEQAEIDREGFDPEEFEAMLHQKLQDGGQEKQKESYLKGEASHSITVDFHACEAIGSTDEEDDEADSSSSVEVHRFVHFRTRGETESLQLAYASTCHKMQGAECPTTIVICHEVFGRMLSREWLYTACTRASEKILLLYTPRGLQRALANQRVKGKTLEEKVQSFRQYMESMGEIREVKGLGPKEPKLPEAKEL